MDCRQQRSIERRGRRAGGQGPRETPQVNREEDEIARHQPRGCPMRELWAAASGPTVTFHQQRDRGRSEEHTSELQSLAYLVCRLLLEKKKQIYTTRTRRFLQPLPRSPATQ